MPSAVSRMKSARLVCIARSEVGVQPAAIENAGWVESGLQATVDFHQRCGQRCEHSGTAVIVLPGAENRCVATGLFGADAYGLRVGVGNPPALAAAPFHQLGAG